MAGVANKPGYVTYKQTGLIVSREDADKIAKDEASLNALKKDPRRATDPEIKKAYEAAKAKYAKDVLEAVDHAKKKGHNVSLADPEMFTSAITDDYYSDDRIKDPTKFKHGPSGDEISKAYQSYQSRCAGGDTSSMPLQGAIHNLWELLYKLEEEVGKIDPEDKEGAKQMQLMMTKIQAAFQMINQMTELQSNLLKNESAKTMIGNMR